MARMSIEQIRRRELIDAAYAMLQQHGLAGTTLARVAESAGVSKGIVLHYFANKDALIAGVMRFANAVLRDEVIALMRAATTPRQRLQAIVDGNFSPTSFRPEIAHAWLALCAEVPRNREFARIQRVIHARMHSNLLSALVSLVQRDEAPRIALGISAMVDGLWLRCGLQGGGIDRAIALDQMALYVDSVLPTAVSVSR
jgi:TetR/AcrR family transcriptional repressor of bet genes